MVDAVLEHWLLSREMIGKLKYNISPFHFLSLWFLYEMIIGFSVNARLGDKAGLGAIEPFIYLAFFLATLFADFVIQFVVSIGFKPGWKMVWLMQILIIVLVLLFTTETVHYANLRDT